MVKKEKIKIFLNIHINIFKKKPVFKDLNKPF